MEPSSPQDFYEENIRTLKEQLKDLQRRARLTGLSRLICGLVILISLIYIFSAGGTLWCILLGLSIVVFILLVRYSTLLNTKLTYTQTLYDLNENERKGLMGDYTCFDGGNDLMDGSHPYAFDLDLFGDKSLFQRINRTVTVQGRGHLASALAAPDQAPEAIRAKQLAISEIASLPKWRQRFLVTGTLTKETVSDRRSIETWLHLPPVLGSHRIWPKLLVGLPLVTLLFWICYLFGPWNLSISVPILFSLLQLGITGNQGRFINERHQLISKRGATLKKYHELVVLISEEDFQSKEMQQLQTRLDAGSFSTVSFQRLLKLINALDNRLNILMAIILNALLLWDLNCLIRIEKWNAHFKAIFPSWMEVIGETDALISLAGFNFNHPDYVMPVILDRSPDNGFHLEMKDGGHPLLYPEPCITNSLSQPAGLNLFLITGANMAGKSTFLRTVGLNMILAMSGANVCARSLSLTPVQIYTSMRTNDSLQKHTSFFYAELKRLQWIVEKIKAREPVYILLDEILKGTNSRDQHLGSAELIKNIVSHQGRGLIATHDIELTALAEALPGHIRNIAFEIEMVNDKMVFSYQYKDGVCQNMNASILMKQMGIT